MADEWRRLEVTPEMIEQFQRRRRLKLDFDGVRNDLPERWDMLRRIYDEVGPDVLTGRCDPYFVDWLPLFTPIEYAAWCSIRFKGIPLYPQVPVLQYFIDFASPQKKIGVEVDGKQWHDTEKDRRRDERLFEHGWRIFRIPGRECVRDWMTEQEMDDAWLDEEAKQQQTEHWYSETSDGVFQALKIFYFSRNNPTLHPHYDLAARSLNWHRLVDFEL